MSEWVLEVDENKNILEAKWVQELVRCKDCLFRYKYISKNDPESWWWLCEKELELGDPYEIHRAVWDDDWFCADGERRED